MSRILPRALSLLLAFLVAVPALMVQAAPASNHYFGDGNLPPTCSTAAHQVANSLGSQVAFFEDGCYHMRTGLNNLDTPLVDVLIVPPASMHPERDTRTMMQSVRMISEGIEYLAPRMGLQWLADGFAMNVVVDDGKVSTHPLWDPEIIVVASNPAGGAGIGIDPFDFMREAGMDVGGFIFGEDGPCHGVPNPLATLPVWEALDGFNGHHGHGQGGTYVEDCSDQGGSVCFSVNPAIEPAPHMGLFDLFDLVSHETGHCLSMGHVGDAEDHRAAAVPYSDIMSYTAQPHYRCLSTLDVEALAITMSPFLLDEPLEANNAASVPQDILGNPFQVQHPNDHLYASPTGKASDCPQPDDGLPPLGDRVSFTPTPVDPPQPMLSVDPLGASVPAGPLVVSGTVEMLGGERPPATTHAAVADAADDATPATELLGLAVEATATHLDAVLSLAQIWPSAVTSPISYSLQVDSVTLDSFVRYPVVDGGPLTWDGAGYLPAGTSTWDEDANTVSFHVPYAYLAGRGLPPQGPFHVAAMVNVGSLLPLANSDRAPDTGSLGVTTAADLADSGERVRLLLGGLEVASDVVDSRYGPAVWTLGVDVSDLAGSTAALEVRWTDGTALVASHNAQVDVEQVVPPLECNDGDDATHDVCLPASNVVPLVGSLVREDGLLTRLVNDQTISLPMVATVSDPNGCLDVVADLGAVVRVGGQVVADLSGADLATTGCGGEGDADLTADFTVELPAGTPAGTYTVTFTATDLGGLSATRQATFEVRLPPVVTIAYTGGLGHLQFPQAVPGALAVTSVNAFQVSHDHEAAQELLFDLEAFSCSGCGTIPTAGFTTLLIDGVAVPYSAAPLSLGTIDPGQVVEVQVRLDSLPAVLPSGNYRSTFGVVTAD